MAPWLRALRTACLLLVLTAGAVHPAHAADPAPSGDASRAGSRYGEGRERPGRTEPRAPETVPSYPSLDPPAADRSHDTALAPNPTLPPTSPEPPLHVLPLGGGLILMGLGLGTAFVGLRVRRR